MLEDTGPEWLTARRLLLVVLVVLALVGGAVAGTLMCDAGVVC